MMGHRLVGYRLSVVSGQWSVVGFTFSIVLRAHPWSVRYSSR